ncbi:EamA family transporter [Rhodococcus sp. T2V]|uniref:EamA family transporter n=1 Tax=Rhodococcus sp. T2V TaxID=3034164 RepID=UPI0023E15B89|nr:EamA family transporter [Rhodococcus sp. T2V]MDF3306228.1 EamA family transporter [Rhodococcus sp. T2V]
MPELSNLSTRSAALGAVVLSGVSFQLGAAVGALIMPTVGFVGVVAIRMMVAAPVLLLVGRPRLREFSRRQLIQVIALGVVMATMSLTLFAAIERVGLGLAVTIEFLGPLTISLFASRRMRDAVGALVVAVAVVLLAGADGQVDLVGILLAFIAATCWATAITLNGSVGKSIPGNAGPAVAMTVGAVFVVPVGLAATGTNFFDLHVLWAGAGTALLASVFPPLLELFAIRRLSRAAYGTSMALYPAVAALCGWVVLDEGLGIVEWCAVSTICVVSALTTYSASRPGDLLAVPGTYSRSTQTSSA